MEVGGGVTERREKGVADVICMHKMLTNQIILFHFETVVTHADYAFAKCELKMALFKAWIAEISANPSLVTSAVEEGLHQLGYESIKPEQLAAVESLLKGEDVFMSVPMGFGKSLVYQVLPFRSESLLCSCKNSWTFKSPVVIVVSPLISLTHDQVSKLVAKEVKAMCISGEKSGDVFTDVESQVTHVFGSPEAFIGNKAWHSIFSDDCVSG